MKSKLLNIRLKPEEIERLHLYAGRYGMRGGVFIKKLVLALVDDKVRQESENFMRKIQKDLQKQSEDLGIFTQVIADTSSRLASDIGQSIMVFNGKKKRTKQKQTSPKR